MVRLILSGFLVAILLIVVTALAVIFGSRLLRGSPPDPIEAMLAQSAGPRPAADWSKAIWFASSDPM